MRKMILPIVVAAVFFALSFAPISNADDWAKKTVVTFDQDAEIPDQVLPAGTYVFKLLRSTSNRNIVQVWTDHEQQIVATLITVGNSYPDYNGDPYFVLDLSGTDEGYPPAVVSWFFPGSNEGRDFIYKGWSTTRMLDNEVTYAAPQQ